MQRKVIPSSGITHRLKSALESALAIPLGLALVFIPSRDDEPYGAMYDPEVRRANSKATSATIAGILFFGMVMLIGLLMVCISIWDFFHTTFPDIAASF